MEPGFHAVGYGDGSDGRPVTAGSRSPLSDVWAARSSR